MTFYFEGGISATCDPACPEGQYCDNGICFKGDKPEGSFVYGECISGGDCQPCTYCINNRCHAAYDGWFCTPEDEDVPGQCHAGRCIPKGDGCTTNADCKESGTFCASTNASDTERFPSGETGVCVKIDFVKKEFDGKPYYISNSLMSWWDAEYACEAIGGNVSMVSITDLVEESSWDRSDYDQDIVLTPFGQALETVLGGSYPVWGKEISDSGLVFDLIFYGYPVVRRNNHIYATNLALCR